MIDAYPETGEAELFSRPEKDSGCTVRPSQIVAPSTDTSPLRVTKLNPSMEEAEHRGWV